jgi:hypothetical protein
VQQLSTCISDKCRPQTSYSGFLLQIVAKAEFLNPGGSVKDRVALHIIQDAFAGGLLTEGGLITEGTAGSTGRHPPIKILVNECPALRAACYHMQNQLQVMNHVIQSLVFTCATRLMSHSSSSMCLLKSPDMHSKLENDYACCNTHMLTCS